jgi:cyclophilin family peptidyl-prolyl cis-trans isomerase
MRSLGFSAVRRALTPIVCLLALLPAAGCGSDDSGTAGGDTTAETAPADTQVQTTATPPSGCKEVAQPPAKPDGGQKKPAAELDAGTDYKVEFVTNCGSFTVDVDEAGGLTAASFVKLAEDGFYANTFFHRIAPGFVIQGGDPTGSGLGGPGYTTKDPPPRDLKYAKGSVAMAKGGAEPPGTAGSQFFVVTAAAGAANLTPDYALVGEISDGMDVVDRIAQLGDVAERPTQVVRISKARVRSG